MKKKVFIISSVCIILIILFCAAFAVSCSGMNYYCKAHVVCTYTLTKKQTLSDILFKDPSQKESLEYRLAQNRVPSQQRRACMDDPAAYSLISFDININNSSDFRIVVVPHFRNTDAIWFAKKSVEQRDKGASVYCMPHETSSWGFTAIVKNDRLAEGFSLDQIKTTAIAGIIHGPYVHCFSPASRLQLSAETSAAPEVDITEFLPDSSVFSGGRIMSGNGFLAPGDAVDKIVLYDGAKKTYLETDHPGVFRLLGFISYALESNGVSPEWNMQRSAYDRFIKDGKYIEIVLKKDALSRYAVTRYLINKNQILFVCDDNAGTAPAFTNLFVFNDVYYFCPVYSFIRKSGIKDNDQRYFEACWDFDMFSYCNVQL